jgi:hypothetical protein
MDLSGFPASAKFLCYWLQRSGFPPDTGTIISVYSEQEHALKQECESWLENGSHSCLPQFIYRHRLTSRQRRDDTWPTV